MSSDNKSIICVCICVIVCTLIAVIGSILAVVGISWWWIFFLFGVLFVFVFMVIYNSILIILDTIKKGNKGVMK